MKKLYATTTIALGLFFIAYLGLWLYCAKWFEQEINQIYAHSASRGIVFLGEKPKLSNFPFVPEVQYSQGFQSSNFKILFPSVVIRGYPLPNTKLHLFFPKGIALGGMVDEQIWNLQSLEADISIPYHLPSGFYEEDLRAWLNNKGQIHVTQYKAQKDSLNAVGSGFLTLDNNLQPLFSFESVIKGYDLFIEKQKDKKLIDPFAAAIGMTILNSLSKIDEATGEKNVFITISVQNQMLSVGPIQALPLPLIVWDKRRLPVPHQ